MIPLYIFDLDGTLARLDHRLHYVRRNPNDARIDWRPDWRAFFAACDKDSPNVSVICTLKLLKAAGADIWIFSGRSDECAGKTLDWLSEHVGFFCLLRMRAEGDYRPDEIVKAEWLSEMRREDRDRLAAVFDDRRKVVDMWRSQGIPCFQVADGDF